MALLPVAAHACPCSWEHPTQLSPCLALYKLYGNTDVPVTPQDVSPSCPFMFTSAPGSTTLEQFCVFPSLISWEKTFFPPHLQGRFSKQSSPLGPQNWRSWSVPCAPAEPFPVWIIQPQLGIPGSCRAHQVIAGPGHPGDCRNSVTPLHWDVELSQPLAAHLSTGVTGNVGDIDKTKLALSKMKNKLKKKSPVQNLPQVHPNVWFSHQANIPCALQAFPF